MRDTFRLAALALLVFLAVPSLITGQIANLPCRTYGGQQAEQANALAEAPGHGFLMAGWTASFGADTNILLVRTDSTGVPLVPAKITSSFEAGGADRAYSAVRTRDGGYAVTGMTRSYGAATDAKFFVLRLDSLLNLVWGRVFNSPYDDFGRSIIQTVDSGFAVAGYLTNSSLTPPQSRIVVLKLDQTGSLQWVHLYQSDSGTVQSYQAFGIAEAPPGLPVRYAVVGQGATNYRSTGDDAFLLRLDSAGTVLPSEIMSGPHEEGARSVVFDGAWNVAGWTGSFPYKPMHDADIFVSKLNPIIPAPPIWSRVYGWPETDDALDGDRSLTLVSGGGLALAGWTRSKGPGTPTQPNFWMLRLTQDSGNVVWSRIHPSIPGAGAEQATAMLNTTRGKFAATGYTNSFGLGADDFHLVTLDQNGNRPVCVLDSSPAVDSCPWQPWEFDGFSLTLDLYLMTLTNVSVQSSVVCSLTLRDVGPTRIIRPAGLIDSSQTIVPACTVYNFGTGIENYRVRMQIGSFYDQYSDSVLAHAPGTGVLVTFPSYTAWPRGRHNTTVTTGLVGDENPNNDMLADSVTVRVRDVGCLYLLRPLGTVDSGVTITPACSVYNYGTDNATYTVRLRIGTGYNQTQTVFNQAPGATNYVEFLVWTPVQVGAVLAETCGTELPFDAGPINDKKGARLVVRRPGGHDVACTRIIKPIGTADSGTTVTPMCSVYNYGASTETYTVRMKIGPTYEWAASVFNHTPGTAQFVTFQDWVAGPTGMLAVSCSTELGIDDTPEDDKQVDSVLVLRPGPDMALTAIIRPTGRVTFNDPLIPACSLFNGGNAAYPYKVYMRIGVNYFDSIEVTGHAPTTYRIVNLPAWLPDQIGSLNVLAYCDVAGDLERSNDTARGACKVDSGGVVGWIPCQSMPIGDKSKRVKDGGSLAYNVENDSGYVYAFKGNNRCEFYKYVNEVAGWETRESIPAIGSSLKKKTVKKGGRLAQGNGMIYAIKGNNSLEFWEYEPGLVGRWTQKRDVPLGARNLKEGTGLSGVKIGDTTYIYLLKGSGTQEFYRYNTASDNWQSMASAPAGASGRMFKNGSCITYDGANTIYALKATTNEFFAYDIAANTWATLPGLPLTGSAGKKKVKDGAALACVGGLVFALKGGNTFEFWAHDPIAGTWNEREVVPAGGGKRVKGGGAMVATPAVIHALKGNNTLEFYMYKPSSSGSPGPERANELTRTSVPAVIGLSVTPNPFQGRARISYMVPRAGPVSLRLYDVTGKLASTLVAGQQGPGSYELLTEPSALARGIYVLKLETPGTAATSKLIVE
jgi:hypothetical protein